MILQLKDYAKCIKTTVRSANWHLFLWAVSAPIYCRIFYGIGARDFSLYSLFRKPTKTWSNYISNEPFKSVLASEASIEHRKIADDKHKFQNFCHLKNINTPQILNTYDFTSPDSADDFYRTIKNYEDGDYFAKSRSGSHGENAFSFTVLNNSVTISQEALGATNIDDVIKQLTHSKSSIIVQKKVLNHHSITLLTSSESLSTIRVVSVKRDNEIIIISACARIIVGYNHTDSFLHGQSGNLVAEIDLSAGSLVRCKHSINKSWPEIVDLDKHPISGLDIIGFKIPFWNELIIEVKKAHTELNGLKSVGWDVAITNFGVQIMEANWRYDVDLIQVSHDRGFIPVIQSYFTIPGK